MVEEGKGRVTKAEKIDPDYDSRTPGEPVGWQGVDFGHQKWIPDLGSPRPLSSREWVVKNSSGAGLYPSAIHKKRGRLRVAGGEQPLYRMGETP